MIVSGPSETPQWIPGAKRTGAEAIAVSINRYSWEATSATLGHDPTYAFDNNVRTWWQPAADDAAPSLTLDLGCRNPADANQEFFVTSARVLFEIAPPERKSLKVDGHAAWFPDAPRVASPVYQYRIETSLDNKNFTTVLDRTGNTKANNVEFGEFAPVRCRWIRLTITGCSKDMPLAVLEFTAFGQPVEGSGSKK
jgi:hypothetical protein